MIDDMLICYNWMPVVADCSIDHPEQFYTNHGISRLHDHEMIYPEAIGVMKDNFLIFVKTDYIVDGSFQTHWLNRIQVPFNLITGVSSYQVGRDGANPSSYKQILENPFLKNWFSTNPPEEEHEKIHALPIGFAEPSREESEQGMLKRLQKEAIPFQDKKNIIFIPWHNKDTNTIRYQLMEKIKNNLKNSPHEEQMEKQQIEPYLRAMNENKFIICFEGSGNDTHRFYECLLMGSVPIIKESTVKRLFDEYDLPAVFIKDWDEVDENFFEDISNREYDFSNVENFLKVQTHVDKIKELL